MQSVRFGLCSNCRPTLMADTRLSSCIPLVPPIEQNIQLTRHVASFSACRPTKVDVTCSSTIKSGHMTSAQVSRHCHAPFPRAHKAQMSHLRKHGSNEQSSFQQRAAFTAVAYPRHRLSMTWLLTVVQNKPHTACTFSSSSTCTANAACGKTVSGPGRVGSGWRAGSRQGRVRGKSSSGMNPLLLLMPWLLVAPHAMLSTRTSTAAAAAADEGVCEIAEDGGEEGSTAAAAGISPSSSSVLLFTTPTCRFCREAKAVLRQEGVAADVIREHDVSSRPLLRAALAEATGRRTVPVIFIKGELIGGCSELKERVAAGGLPSLLASSASPLPASLLSALQAAEGEQGEGQGPPGGSSSRGEVGVGGRALASLAQSDIRLLRLEGIASMMHSSLVHSPATSELPHTSPSLSSSSSSSSSGAAAAAPSLWSLPLSSLLRTAGGSSGDSFTGAAAVDWMLKYLPDIETRQAAVLLGREMQSRGLLNHVEFAAQFADSSETQFRLHADEAPVSSALNGHPLWLRATQAATNVADNLRVKVEHMYSMALSEDGKTVDYSGLAASPAFHDYVEAARELQRVDLFGLSRAEKLAFWLNIYNSLVIHSLVLNGPPASLPERFAMYKRDKYLIGGHEYSLDDIEHGVLRGNSPPAGGIPFLPKKRPFGPTDPRRFQSLPPVDPRIHFALNCGAKSCPPVRVFRASSLEDDLEAAAAAFLEEEVEIDGEKKEITLSKLLDWYGADFGESLEKRLVWIASKLDPTRSSELLRGVKEKFKVKFKTYDWDVNSS